MKAYRMDYMAGAERTKQRRERTEAQKQLALLEAGHLEQAFVTQVRMLGLPEPEREVALSNEYAYRWDFVWPRYRLAVEINGGIWNVGGHSTGKGILRDMTKLKLATLAGYRSFQFSADAVEDGSAVNTVEKFILGYREMVRNEWAALEK